MSNYGWFLKDNASKNYVHVDNPATKATSLVALTQATKFDTADQARVALKTLALDPAKVCVVDATIPTAPTPDATKETVPTKAQIVEAAKAAAPKGGTTSPYGRARFGAGRAQLRVPATPNPPATPATAPVTDTPAPSPAVQAPQSEASASAAPQPALITVAPGVLPERPLFNPPPQTNNQRKETGTEMSSGMHALAQRIAATKQKWDGAVGDVNARLDEIDAKAPVVLGHAHVVVSGMQGDLQGMEDGLNALADTVVPLAQAAPVSAPVSAASPSSSQPVPVVAPLPEAAPPAAVAPAPIPMQPIATPAAVAVPVKS